MKHPPHVFRQIYTPEVWQFFSFENDQLAKRLLGFFSKHLFPKSKYTTCEKGHAPPETNTSPLNINGLEDDHFLFWVPPDFQG